MITTSGPPPENMLNATPVLLVWIELDARGRARLARSGLICRADDRLGDLVGDDDRHRDERGAQDR